MKRNKGNSGQGLIEYLLLVAVMGIAAIGVVQILSHTVRAKFAQVAEGLNGRETRPNITRTTQEHYRTRSMDDFISGAANQ